MNIFKVLRRLVSRTALALAALLAGNFLWAAPPEAVLDETHASVRAVMADQKTACLKVMLVRQDPTLKRAIPRQIEGYPVVTEVTGPIRPMRQ